jgi:glycosyltransferase involved in cell wall biosynthesis
MITNSEETRSSLVREGLANPDRIYVVPNAIDTSSCLKSAVFERSSTGGTVRVVFLGRLIPSKRVDRFLRALSLARQTAPQIVGLIAGDGPERDKAAWLARELRLTNGHVVFLGHYDDSQRLLASADMLAFTSDDMEGSPNAILEAMAAAVPVVTTRSGNAASLIRNGISGFVCGFEESSIAEKIVELARSAELRRRMGVAARRRVIDCYGTDRLAFRLISVYRAVAAAREDVRLIQILGST